MGNFSSCSAGFHSIEPLVHSPPLVAKVLLVDGSMLKFKVPIRVVKLLRVYPNHLICPLDSLAPGLHSLSSLPPDEKLQLGRLYLLLPFKPNMQKSCIKSKQEMQQKGDTNEAFMETQDQNGERGTMLLGPGLAENTDKRLANCAKLYKSGDMGLHGECSKLQSTSLLVQQGEHGRKTKLGRNRTAGMVKTEVGLQECAGVGKEGDVGTTLPSRRRAVAATAGSYGKFNGERRRRGRRETCMREGQNIGSKPACCDISPLCDTPELQRAYRSFLLRRSCSWTPRLQPILERR